MQTALGCLLLRFTLGTFLRIVKGCGPFLVCGSVPGSDKIL